MHNLSQLESTFMQYSPVTFLIGIMCEVNIYSSFCRKTWSKLCGASLLTFSNIPFINLLLQLPHT